MQHLNRIARAVMRTMLFRAGRKPGAPVKRADLVAAVDAAHASAGAGAGRRHHAAVGLALATLKKLRSRLILLNRELFS